MTDFLDEKTTIVGLPTAVVVAVQQAMAVTTYMKTTTRCAVVVAVRPSCGQPEQKTQTA